MTAARRRESRTKTFDRTFKISPLENGLLVWRRVFAVHPSGAAGTVIGQRQLWQLAPTKAETVALVIDAAKDIPAIAEFGLYWEAEECR